MYPQNTNPLFCSNQSPPKNPLFLGDQTIEKFEKQDLSTYFRCSTISHLASDETRYSFTVKIWLRSYTYLPALIILQHSSILCVCVCVCGRMERARLGQMTHQKKSTAIFRNVG